MKDRANNLRSKLSRKSLVAMIAISVVIIAVATALSMQTGRIAEKAQTMPQSSAAVAKSAKKGIRNIVTASPSGQIVSFDRQTGESRPLTQDESKRLADGLKKLINRSTEGLVEVRMDDGTISMDLQGRFQNVMVAKQNEDGNLDTSCLDNLEAAADFFEIDPKLLGIQPKKR